MDEFIVSKDMTGYVYIGHAQGRFEPEGGGEKRPYYNIYVISPVSDYKSEDYDAAGFKAEKLRCVSADVWGDIEIGEEVRLFFDDKKRVQMAVSVSAMSAMKRGDRQDQAS